MNKDKPLSEKEIIEFNLDSAYQEGFQKAKEQYASALKKVKEEFESNITVISKRAFLNALDKHFGEFK